MDKDRSSTRRSIIIVSLAGALALTVSGYALKDIVLEHYWLGKLRSEDPELQRVAADRLAELRSVRAVRRLVELCARHPEDFRAYGFEPDEPKYFVDSDSGEEKPPSSCACVVPIGPRSVDELLEIFREYRESEDSRLDEVAAWILGELRATRALPALVESYSEVAESAVVKFGRRAVPLLSSRVADGSLDYWKRRQAAELLGRIGLDAAEAVPVVAGLLDREGFRETAIDALARMGPSSVPYLAPLLEDHSFEVLQWTVTALGDIGVASADILTDALDHREILIRELVAEELWKLGEDPRVVSALFRALESEEPTVCHYAAVTLGRIGPPAVVPLVRRLGSAPDELVSWIEEALVGVGTDATAALLRAVETGEGASRLRAVHALGILKDPGAGPTLAGLLEESEVVLRREAMRALATMG